MFRDITGIICYAFFSFKFNYALFNLHMSLLKINVQYTRNSKNNNLFFSLLKINLRFLSIIRTIICVILIVIKNVRYFDIN